MWGFPTRFSYIQICFQESWQNLDLSRAQGGYWHLEKSRYGGSGQLLYRRLQKRNVLSKCEKEKMGKCVPMIRNN